MRNKLKYINKYIVDINPINQYATTQPNQHTIILFTLQYR